MPKPTEAEKRSNIGEQLDRIAATAIAAGVDLKLMLDEAKALSPIVSDEQHAAIELGDNVIILQYVCGLLSQASKEIDILAAIASEIYSEEDSSTKAEKARADFIAHISSANAIMELAELIIL